MTNFQEGKTLKKTVLLKILKKRSLRIALSSVHAVTNKYSNDNKRVSLFKNIVYFRIEQNIQ